MEGSTLFWETWIVWPKKRNILIKNNQVTSTNGTPYTLREWSLQFDLQYTVHQSTQWIKANMIYMLWRCPPSRRPNTFNDPPKKYSTFHTRLIFQIFKLHLYFDHEVNKQETVCKIRFVATKYKRGNTSNMITHLTTQQMIWKSSTLQDSKMYHDITMCLTDWIIKGQVSLSSVDDKKFK